jgi:hypothetical protein
MSFRVCRVGLVVFVLGSAFPSVAEGSAIKPPTRSVVASRVVTTKGVTCAYLRKSGKPKGLKNSWVAGTRTGKKSFTVHADAAAFYKSKGRKFRPQYVAAKKRTVTESKTCGRLTSLKFKTKGFVAMGLSEQSITTKGVQSSGLKTSPIAGLYGITETGSVAGVISPVDPSDNKEVLATKIVKSYQAPDGSIYTQYSSHPNLCLVGRVLAILESEECVVVSKDLPKGFQIGDGGGKGNETTELIQFDNIGNVYLNLFGVNRSSVTPECMVKVRDRATNMVIARDLIMVISTTGVKNLMPNDACLFIIQSWAPLQSGGILYSMGGSVQPGDKEGVARVLKWRDGNSTLVKSGVSLTANGIQSMPGGKTLINVFDSAPEVFPREHTVQGGIFLYDDATDSLTTWFHYADQSPTFAHENLDSIHCDCVTQLALFQPLAATNGTLYGVGSLGDTSPQPVVGDRRRDTSYLWKLYPSVTPLVAVPRIPSGKSYSYAAATTKSVVLASDGWNRSDARCECSMELIDLETFAVTNLLKPTEGLAVLSLAASEDGSQIVAQAIRTVDKNYFIGVVDSINGVVKWAPTGIINYRWMLPLSK